MNLQYLKQTNVTCSERYANDLSTLYDIYELLANQVSQQMLLIKRNKNEIDAEPAKVILLNHFHFGKLQSVTFRNS